MRVKKNVDHILIGMAFAILGTLLGLLLIEVYWLTIGYKLGTVWNALLDPSTRTSFMTLSQVPNVGVFYLFFQSQRDRSAYGIILFFFIIAIPVAIEKFL